MLNTDMCLFYDLEQAFPCCSRIDQLRLDGTNRCNGFENTECLEYATCHSRKEAAIAVDEFARGGGNGFNNDNNEPNRN